MASVKVLVTILMVVFVGVVYGEASTPVAGEDPTGLGDIEGLDLTRQGTPSTGPCPPGCKCFANEEACKVFVDCHNAGLKSVPGPDQIDPAADCIDLSQNGLPASAGMFSHFPAKLAYLELHGNKFGEGSGMPGNAFATLPELVHLGLEQNKLQTVPSDLLAGLSNLKVIYLSHNELASLPEDLFKSTPDLRVLLLQHNKLESVADNTFNHLKALKVLKLVDNPLAAKANESDAAFKDMSLFQLDLQSDNGDYYEDTMLEGLKDMSDLGREPVDEDAVRKLQEQGKIDEDLFSMDDFSADDMDSDADAFIDESDDDALGSIGDSDGDALHGGDESDHTDGDDVSQEDDDTSKEL